MLADIAEAGGAEQCVGDGVEDDVGIAVAGEAAVVGDGNPAEHDRPVAGEGVDVEAHAGARHDQARAQDRFGPLAIGGGRQLVEHRIALDDRHLQSGGTHAPSIRRSGWARPTCA